MNKVQVLEMIRSYNSNTISSIIFITVNCIDRHKEVDPDRVALIWEKDEPKQEQRVTYK